MAEKKAVKTYDQIMRDLRARRFAPVYFLMGEEAYFIDKIEDYIGKNVLSPEEQDFNQTVVYAADTAGNVIADMARRYPMMAERQVIIVREAQGLKNWESIENYMNGGVMKSTVLVFCYKNGAVDQRKKAFKTIFAQIEKQKGVIFNSQKKRDTDLPPFIADYLKEKNATIDYKSAQMMADHIGSDLLRLTSELDKILISLPEDNRCITPDIVEREIGINKDFNTLELRNAIINKNVFKANQIINYFDKNPKAGSVYSMVPLIFNFFQNLLVAHFAPNKDNAASVAQYIGAKNQWGVRDYMTGIRNYDCAKTIQIISKMREIDAKSKGIYNPSTSSEELIKELIFFILH